MRGSKAKRIRKAIYEDISPKIPRDPGSQGEMLRREYQKAKRAR